MGLGFRPRSTLHGNRTMPRIQTTRTVTIALIALRIYLAVMLVLILVKFLGIFRG